MTECLDQRTIALIAILTALVLISLTGLTAVFLMAVLRWYDGKPAARQEARDEQ